MPLTEDGAGEQGGVRPGPLPEGQAPSVLGSDRQTQALVPLPARAERRGSHSAGGSRNTGGHNTGWARSLRCQRKPCLR